MARRKTTLTDMVQNRILELRSGNTAASLLELLKAALADIENQAPAMFNGDAYYRKQLISVLDLSEAVMLIGSHLKTFPNVLGPLGLGIVLAGKPTTTSVKMQLKIDEKKHKYTLSSLELIEGVPGLDSLNGEGQMSPLQAIGLHVEAIQGAEGLPKDLVEFVAWCMPLQGSERGRKNNTLSQNAL